MKKIIYKTLLLLIFIGIATSCETNKEEAIFEESTAQRLKNSISEYKELLTSSDNGWIIEYYPEKTQKYGGFNYGVKFNNDLTAEVVMELFDFSTRQSNSYNVIANGGPLLSFDTYNAITHFFATPNSNLADGLEGDYEFFLISKTDDVITLRGSQSRNNMRMIRLTETPEAYLTKVNNIGYTMSLATGIAINGESNNVNFGNRHIAFSVVEGDDVNMAYNYTTTGIKLYEPITIAGNEVSEFTLDKTQNQLISLDGNVVIDLIIAPFNINQDWSIDTTDFSTISADFFGKYVDIYNANGARYGEYLQRKILFGNTLNGSGIQFSSLEPPTQFWTAEYNLTFSAILGQSDQLAVAKNAGGLNWSYYTHLDPLVDYIVDNAPYTAVPNTTTNPTEITLTSTVDADAWFVIKL